MESDDNTAEVTNKVKRFLILQIWIGGLCGLLCCSIVGAMIIFAFYHYGKDLWSQTEHYWEGTFSIVASIVISIMGMGILRVHKMRSKWISKFSNIIEGSDYIDRAIELRESTTSYTSIRHWFKVKCEKYSMFFLPFVTTLREGMEAIVFVGGIGVNENTTFYSIFNSFVAAIALGSVIGVLLYRLGNTLPLTYFLIGSTVFLYLVAARLLSKGVWQFELQQFINKCGGLDVSETGHGPGSYDIKTSVWHVNCCNGELQNDGVFWMIFTAVFGWTNSATYGSIISYNLYWIVVISMVAHSMYVKKHGALFMSPLNWSWNKKLKYSRLGPDRPIEFARTSSESAHSETPLTT